MDCVGVGVEGIGGGLKVTGNFHMYREWKMTRAGTWVEIRDRFCFYRNGNENNASESKQENVRRERADSAGGAGHGLVRSTYYPRASFKKKRKKNSLNVGNGV